MKKVLIGCGVLMLLGLVLVGGSLWWLGKTFTGVAGDLITATQTAMTMSLDRMEQDAVAISAVDLGAHIAEHSGKPVRVTGTYVKMTDLHGSPPPGMDPQTALFLAPAVVVMTQSPDVLPVRRVEGMELEVLGIASRLNLAAIPGADDKALREMREKLGGTEMPVVVARRARVVKEAPEAKEPVQPAP